MSLVLNTNINALMTQNNLNASQNSLTTAMQRLSSGLRINSAADDAAGLAISSRMTTQINGLTQASQNANDGISLAQTAEGALTELTNNLQSIRELAVEAANATNSDSDRAAIDQEVQQDLQQVDTIATQTTFNGQHVLDGTLGSATFQVGANVGETIGINLNTSMKTTSIGSLAQASSGNLTSLFNAGAGLTLAAGALTVNGTSVAAGTYTTAASLITAINTAAGSTVASASGNEIKITNTSTTTPITIAGSAATTLGLSTVADATVSGAGLTLAAGALTVNGASVAAGTYTTAASLITAINTAAGSTVASASGNEIKITNTSTTTPITIAGSAATTLGLSTVGDATAGAAATAGSYQSGTISGSFDFSGAATAGSYTSGTIALADDSGTNSVFTVDGHTITLTADYTASSLTAEASDIQTQLTAASSGTYTATVSGSSIVIAKVATGASSTAPVIADVSGGTTWAGGASVAGVDSTNKTFTVDGNNVTLNANDTNLAGLVNDLQTQLGGTYAVTSSGGGVNIAYATAGAHAAPVIAGTNATFITTGGAGTVGTAAGTTVDATGTSTGVNTAVSVAGTTTDGAVTSTGVNTAVTATGTATPLTLAAGDLTIQLGTGAAVDMAGTYNTAQDLADAITSQVSGMDAVVNASGGIDLSAGDSITVGGTMAGTGTGNLGFTVGSTAVSGSLRGSNVLTVASANDLMNRIDSALTSVDNFNSVLGAIQNRFQSVINSDAAGNQNITEARSRIQDADFAAETTNMTSANILQQAGISVLAQANSSQQSILKLLQ